MARQDRVGVEQGVSKENGFIAVHTGPFLDPIKMTGVESEIKGYRGLQPSRICMFLLFK